MYTARRIPIKYQVLREPVTFVLRDTEGNILDDSILPPCTAFTNDIAVLIFSGCSGIMRSSGRRYAVLDVIGHDKKVRQRIDFDAQLFREWRDSQEEFFERLRK